MECADSTMHAATSGDVCERSSGVSVLQPPCTADQLLLTGHRQRRVRSKLS